MYEPHFSLIIPTLNESHNIQTLLDRLEYPLREMKYEIIIVDDNSQDGTAALARSRALADPRIQVIVREKDKGLSSAVIQGMELARGEILGVMDADLSHDEQLLPLLIRANDGGADLAVGSRRIPGGGADLWPWYRRLTSDIATQLTTSWLNVELTDPMSGFFTMKKSLYERCRTQLAPQGYKILLEIYCKSRPAHVAELPFIFKDRKQDHSKLSGKVIIQFLGSLYALRGYTRHP